MATNIYVTDQLIKITLNGSYGDIDRNRVRGFLTTYQGLTSSVFDGVLSQDETNWDEPATDWYSDRITSCYAIADSDTTTITISGNTFRIPNTVISAVGKTTETLTSELTTWLTTIADTSVEPYATVSQVDPLTTHP